MAKSEAQKPKPRLRNVKSLILLEPIHVKGKGLASSFERKDGTGLVADLDAQVMNIKLKVGGTFVVPFVRVKYWQPDMGVAKE